MLNRILNTWTIVIIFALLTGFVCNGFFPLMFLGLATAFAMCLTVIGFVIDLIVKSSKGVRITGLIFLFFLIATLTSFSRRKVSEDAATGVGDKVIHALYRYKHHSGQFPKDINQLQLDHQTKLSFNKNQHYWTDSTTEEFEIRAWSDGWNVKSFHSKDSTWVLKD